MNTNTLTKQNLILFKAKNLFKKRKYQKALNKLSLMSFNDCYMQNTYAQTDETHNTNKKIQDEKLALSLLCDIAKQNEAQAQGLFYQAQNLEQLGKKDAWRIILNDIKTLDDIQEYLNEMSQEIGLKQIKKDNSISYNDFMQSVDNKKSFKTAFVDSMFSTKIEITNKNELGKLAYDLIKNDFDDIANSFIEYNTLYKTNNDTKTTIINANKNNK